MDLLNAAQTFLLVQEGVIALLYAVVAYKGVRLYRTAYSPVTKRIAKGLTLIGLGLALKALAIAVTILFYFEHPETRVIMWQVSAIMMVVGWHYLFNYDITGLEEWLESKRVSDAAAHRPPG